MLRADTERGMALLAAAVAQDGDASPRSGM